MKAKYLMMAAVGAMGVALAACSDDPKTDFPESEFEIRQLRLDAENTSTELTARSSENPTNAAKSLQYLTVDAQGAPIMTEDDKYVASTITVTLPTDALIAIPGDEIDLEFTPGQFVTTADVTLPDGTKKVLAGEELTTTFELGDFADGCKATGLHTLTQDGSVYNYTGAIYFWHLHPVNLTVTNQATGETANTPKYNAELDAIVCEAVTNDKGEVVYDEDGYPELVDESILNVQAEQQLTLTFAPAYPEDKLTVTLPDGEIAELSAATPTYTWKVNAFEGEASISAVIELMQDNDVKIAFSGEITLVAE